MPSGKSKKPIFAKDKDTVIQNGNLAIKQVLFPILIDGALTSIGFLYCHLLEAVSFSLEHLYTGLLKVF